MSNNLETVIKLNPQGDLVLALPGKDGTLHELTLAAGRVEEILRMLLAKQQSAPQVGKAIGPSWKFLLESGLLATQIKKIPQGQKAAHLELKAKKAPGDLGL